MTRGWHVAYKYNLKNNPELARERHNAQNRAYYERNKEKVKEAQRRRRAKNGKVAG